MRTTQPGHAIWKSSKELEQEGAKVGAKGPPLGAGYQNEFYARDFFFFNHVAWASMLVT